MATLNIEKLHLPGVCLITSSVYEDERGFFMESYNHKLYREYLGEIQFIQDNISCSTYGVFRGMHTQLPPYAQSKLVRVLNGRVIDVVLDINPSSPTYRQSCVVELSGGSGKALFIPAGYAHGFLSLDKDTIFQYKVDQYYQPQSEKCYNYIEYGIDKLLAEHLSPDQWIVSQKDRQA